MGDPKLCLLLLLSTSALAYAQDDDQPACLLAKRYKTLHKYEYRYEAESLNAINGASQLKNGPKASCKVEIEVPQTCSFIVRTTGCSLSEVVNMDAEGNPVFGPAPSSEAFAAEMEKYPLKVVVEGVYDVKLYPEDGESTTILNVKRGIISALSVPLLEEEKNKHMPTIHGKCRTFFTVNSREDIATDISLDRDLSRCDKFVPMRGHTSPLALISGMHYPLAQLIRSSQTCNYKFDNRKKHMTSGSCTEKHILIPFSHKGEYGVTNVGKQELTLVKVSPHNDRVFDHGDVVKSLHMEAVEDKSVVQDKEAALILLRELTILSETSGDRRAHLFQKLVTMVRGMKIETLKPAIPEALAVSRVLTYQVLAQCGTPECSSAIMQILRTFESSSFEVDASVFAMGLISNPSALLIHDMLEMAKYKPSKPIMYALSNVVKRFYRAEEKLIPEINSVAEFMAAQLGDCSGDMDNTFMTLRVIGNMAPAVVTASPALRAAVIQCVNQPAASQAVQQAAIQVYRLTSVPEEGREVLRQVLLDSASPMQKRIAAYLVLMKDPQPTELSKLADVLAKEQDQQFKSFVESHIMNILSLSEPETEELRQKIRDALLDNVIGPIMNPAEFSRNYRIGSVAGNMIFEGTSYLPKEVMLEMTLKAFGYDIDMMEIGMEGKGFEPTVDALFGKNGFFPDSALKTMYFVSENMPLRVREILENMVPALKRDRMKKQASQNLMRDIGRNLNKLVRELKMGESPEAMVYLRLLGNELGYLRTNEMEEMAYSAAMMIESMFKMFPTDLMKALMTKADNTIFAHYIFMDNEFFLPTVTGVPLRIALSGTFTPGIKGGLKFGRDMSEVTFMPSAGIEFVTQVGSHIPEYVNSGLEMHTNIFHESGLRAKISMGRDSVKITIPAPMSPTKLIKMTNTLVAVSGLEIKTIPPTVKDKVDVSECTPVFAGMKYCTALQYVDAFSQETAPYFPFTGDSKFVVELHPTGEVTEYTATVAYELLKEGEEGRQKVDSVNLILRAEGMEPTEARAILKYNRKKNVITGDIQIPDYDVEAGVRLGVVDGNTKGRGTHSISLDFVNKNIPQLSLVGRANLKAMKEGMLQVQLLIPSISADASITANMKRDEELELELKSEIKVMDVTSEQKIILEYDSSKIEVEFKSDVNTDTAGLPNFDMAEKYGNELLDMQVGQTDMKVRHIFKKFVEAANNYMEKYGSDVPYLQNFRVPDMPEISLPKTLFLNTEAKAVYHFNNERFIIAIPLPLGGKSREELNFPPAVTTPHVSLPQFGLEIVSMEIPIPNLAVPESLTLSIPLFGKAEVSTLIKSNLYDMKASVAAGKDVVETPSYSAKFDVTGTSPLDILSIKIEGSGMLVTTESIKAHLKSSLAHKFIEASVSIVEEATITDKINLRSKSKVEATSPFGFNIELKHTGMAGLNTEEISTDNNFEGIVKAGPMYGKTISVQSFTIYPFRSEANIDSTVQFDSTVVQLKNKIAASLANGEFSFVSNTDAFEDILTHVAELSFKDNKLSLKCDANAFVLGIKIHQQAEASAGAGEVVMRMETNADHTDNRVYSLLTAILNVDGLVVNSDATVKLLENEATHKAALKMNKDRLITSGTTTLQSPVALENTFNAGLDASGASLSIINKAAMHGITVDNTNTLTITLSSLDFSSKAEATTSQYASYTHDVSINLKPYTASAKVKNNLNLLMAKLINEAQLQAELYKMDLTGSLKAIYGQEELKHTYQVNYADMTTNAKCSFTGKLFGTHMSHNTELEVAGLAARINNDAHFNSQPMRFDHTIRCSIVPFDVNFDAIFNADGDMSMFGQHSAQLYGKVLLRAQPLAFASSHECRASLTQQLDNGFSLETTFDNKMDNVLSLQEQKTSFRMKSKVNEHAFNQDLSVYNTAEKTGFEASGTILTNILNTDSTDNQEFTISGFVKYDKMSDCHMIHIPLMENLPAFLESIRGLIVHIADALQDYINKSEIRAKLEALPQHVSDFISQLNVEGKLIQLNQYFSDFTQKYVISIEDVEAFLRKDFDILDKINEVSAKVRELIVRFEVDKKVQAVLEKALELIKQLRIEETIQTVSKMMKDSDLPTKVMEVIQRAINYVKTTEIKDFIQELNMVIETIVIQIKSLDYNDFVDYANQLIADYVHYMNNLIMTLEIPQKLEATRDFINFILSTGRGFMERTRELKVAAIIKSLKDIFDQLVFDNLWAFAEFVKQEITNFDVKTEIASYLDSIHKLYKDIITVTSEILNTVVGTIKMVIPKQKITTEIQQIINGLISELMKAELNIPSFIIPFTDLTVPSWKFSMNKLGQIEIPSQLDIPEFTILGSHTVKATSISFDDIKQKIIQLIDLLLNFEIKMFDVDAFFGDLTMNFLPSMPEVTFPEITLPEISFPTIPKVPIEKLVKSLQVPEMRLPTIPSEMMVPCFGKLYGELKFHTPIYIVKTSAEVKNSTESEKTPTFSGFLTSQGTSQTFEFLNYKLDSTARIAIPKMSRIVFAETLKLNHYALGVEHQASLSLYGLSAQAQAKTTIKMTTSPYTANFMNTAFIGMEEGMSASLDTVYSHVVNLPVVDVRNEATVTQKAVVRQEGYTLTLSVDNLGKGMFNANDGNHKSNLHLSLTPSIVTLTFSGDTDSAILKMKQIITAEFGTLRYFKFNHNTELDGVVSGVLSNRLNIEARPIELVFEFQNKGNGKFNLFEITNPKIELQYDYLAIFKPGSQQMNTVALARLNQYKMFYNFTVDNNENEAGIFIATENEANLEFLNSPISIPEIELPFVDFRTPAIMDLNLYEQTGLKNILTTTEQIVNIDAMLVYKKSQATPLVDLMSVIQIPSVGNLITELSFKSAIMNLNVHAGLYNEDDFVFRLKATTASVFEGLKAKLDGTTSLTTNRGIKLANSLSLENLHIKGFHGSTVSISTDTFDPTVSVTTVAKIDLPILNLEANQNLVADSKTKANVISTLSMKGAFDIPVIKAEGRATADHSLKLEGTFDYVSTESSIRANLDGTVMEDYLVVGVLDNDVTLYLNNDGLRSTSKIIADGKLNYGTTKVISMDVNENLAVEASLSRVYAVLKYTGNNEANLFNFNTNGKHVAQATIDLAPTSFTADIEINISQPSSLGDFTIVVKNAEDVTVIKQKMSTSVKFVCPLYTTNLVAVAEGNAPVFKVTFKSSANSVIVFLDYDIDASSTVNVENEALNMINKVVLTHAELTMDVNHIITQALRRRHQADDSYSRHTLNVDITSPTFTDMNLRYAARRDGISASVSSPSAGFLGLQFNSRVPSQMSARVYGRYPSAAEVDVDMLVIRSTSKDADKMKLQIAYNMEVPKAMLTELKIRFPSIISTFTTFADQYQITRNMEVLKKSAIKRINEAYNAAINYDIQMSQLSIFLRNVIVQYQKTVQVFLDAVIKVLRDTQFKLPGSDEMTTLPEVLKKLSSSIAAMLDMIIQNVYESMEVFYNSFVEKISSVKLRMPIGDVKTANQILDEVKTAFKKVVNELVDCLKNMSLDTMLVKIGETLKACVEKSQRFVDSIKSDYLDVVFFNINVLYRNIITVAKNVVDQIAVLNMEQLNNAFEYIMDMFIYVVDQINNTVNGFLQQASEEAQAYMKVNEGRLEIDLPFSFQQ